MIHEAVASELFPHLRIVMGMVIGLAIARLLNGVAGFVQHPNRTRPYPIHLIWVATLLLELVHFWWWQYALYNITVWTFGTFLFLIGYSIILFLICALLFPDRLDDYDGYEGYFMSRRKWFFGLFASTFVIDLFDSMIKGAAYFERFGYQYYIQVPVGLLACAIAIWTTNRRYHLAFVVLHLIYQCWWIAMMYFTTP